MAQRVADLVPAGFNVERTAVEADRMVIWVRAKANDCACPDCGQRSRRVRSRHWRRPADLPLGRRCVELRVMVRRLRCDAALCPRRIFAERFAEYALAPLVRRTERLDHIVHHPGLALGGRPAAAFAARPMTPASNDTLLRVVRRRARRPAAPLAAIGIDDFARRRNHRYGTIVCDLERRRPVALLADRERATAEDWLRGHPDIAVVARDHGGGYGEAIARALPEAVQVADRWYLMHNASQVVARQSGREARDDLDENLVSRW